MAAGDKRVRLVRAEDRPEIGADGVKRDETQVQKADEADHDVETQREGDEDADLDRHFEVVALDRPQERHQEDQHGRAEEKLGGARDGRVDEKQRVESRTP